MTNSPHATVRQWLSGPLPEDVATSLERLAQAEDAAHIAVMPDVHLANEVCVGVALATRELIYPTAVGSDIGCGMAAIAFDCDAALLNSEANAAKVLSMLYRTVPSLKHSAKTASATIPMALCEQPLSHPKLEKLKSREGRLQFGTLGRGNHFIEFQADSEDRLWLMVHSGSRAIGQAITHHHIRPSTPTRNRLASLSAESSAGKAYLADMAWACEYAKLNRMAMIKAISLFMRQVFNVAADNTMLIHGDHNHVRREQHFGEMLWVHRKGALPAGDGECGVIPGSMGTVSFHVTGRGHAAALCSSSHGAGRSMSRQEAARKIVERQLMREMRGIWFDHRQARNLRDEAPSAYKDIRAVMRAQSELTRIERELRPILVYKGD